MAKKYRLPAIYSRRAVVENGGLMSYGIDRTEPFSRAAVLVDKILKGAKPADLPVEQPTKFELAIQSENGYATWSHDATKRAGKGGQSHKITAKYGAQ